MAVFDNTNWWLDYFTSPKSLINQVLSEEENSWVTYIYFKEGTYGKETSIHFTTCILLEDSKTKEVNVCYIHLFHDIPMYCEKLESSFELTCENENTLQLFVDGYIEALDSLESSTGNSAQCLSVYPYTDTNPVLHEKDMTMFLTNNDLVTMQFADAVKGGVYINKSKKLPQVQNIKLCNVLRKPSQAKYNNEVTWMTLTEQSLEEVVPMYIHEMPACKDIKTFSEELTSSELYFPVSMRISIVNSDEGIITKQELKKDKLLGTKLLKMLFM